MMMDARDALTPEELREIEEKVKLGSFEHIKTYFEDAISYHIGSVQELKRRQRLIHDNSGDHVGGWERAGILSALTNNRLGWDAVVNELGNDMPPGFGLATTHYLQKHRPDIATSPEWGDLLQLSVEKGHIPAKMVSFRKKIGWLGLLQGPVYRVYRIFITLRSIPMVLKNPNDSRLPKK